jgi:scyllo-inositol 2-dehydrogenase (NAD+)
VGYLRETPILVMTAAGVNHDVVPHFPERFGQAYIDQLIDFVQNVSEQREPSVTVEDGIKALQVAVAATHSLKTNDRVFVKDF